VVAGALPPGLSMDDETGAVTGTPTLAGGFPFTVEVSNGIVPVAVRQFSIRVVGPASASTASPWTAVLKGAMRPALLREQSALRAPPA
jgi:hypothetical protein